MPEPVQGFPHRFVIDRVDTQDFFRTGGGGSEIRNVRRKAHGGRLLKEAAKAIADSDQDRQSVDEENARRDLRRFPTCSGRACSQPRRNHRRRARRIRPTRHTNRHRSRVQPQRHHDHAQPQTRHPTRRHLRHHVAASRDDHVQLRTRTRHATHRGQLLGCEAPFVRLVQSSRLGDEPRLAAIGTTMRFPRRMLRTSPLERVRTRSSDQYLPSQQRTER